MRPPVRDPGEQRVQTVCLVILTAIAVAVALYWLRPVLVPFLLALFFTYLFSYVMDLEKTYMRLPPRAAAIAAAGLGVIFLVLVGLLFASFVVSLADNAPVYTKQLTAMMDKFAGAAPLEAWGFRRIGPTGNLIRDETTENVLRVPDKAVDWLITNAVSELTGVVSNGALVVIFMVFIVVGRKGTVHAPDGLMSAIDDKVKRYIGVTVAFSVLTGLLIGGSLAVLGVQFAPMFGFLAFLLNFIPSLGSIIATLLPLPVILLDPALSPVGKGLALLIPGIIQIVIGIFQPKAQSDAMDLHPVALLMALIFFGMIWGVVGAFLAAPITAVVKFALEQSPSTSFLARMLGGDFDSPPPDNPDVD